MKKIRKEQSSSVSLRNALHFQERMIGVVLVLFLLVFSLFVLGEDEILVEKGDIK